MFRYNDGSFRQSPPAKVEYLGFVRNFHDLTREQWDELGYNEAVSAPREPFTEYVTAWEKGDDLIFREVVTDSVVDEAARSDHEAGVVRAARDRLLAESDWTQLADSPLESETKAVWAQYRAALRMVPQQAGFPSTVQWPVRPE